MLVLVFSPDRFCSRRIPNRQQFVHVGISGIFHRSAFISYSFHPWYRFTLSRLIIGNITRPRTCNNLNAARLFRPCTAASLVNWSFCWRACQRLDEACRVWLISPAAPMALGLMEKNANMTLTFWGWSRGGEPRTRLKQMFLPAEREHIATPPSGGDWRNLEQP